MIQMQRYEGARRYDAQRCGGITPVIPSRRRCMIEVPRRDAEILRRGLEAPRRKDNGPNLASASCLRLSRS
ncbi:hypothetical protein BD626DRAFT_30018 [Schizophyllum amplum]|uniref:Uncharacterized protein n=1 Tax=Schizophyllum amplum TaxID=97359 RepID=A0A550D0G7_9AGAR|nr:hypothetical protein BD626DRAFT_30018 [Auriculariopsis ampla]